MKSKYTGHDSITRRPQLYHDHGIHVAQRPSIMVAGEPLTFQVMQLGAMPLRLTPDMTVGYINPYEGPTYEVSPGELRERDGPSEEERESPIPGVDVSSVSDEWSGALMDLLKKHAPLWGRDLGFMRDVEQRIRLRPR